MAPAGTYQPSFEALGTPLHQVTFAVLDLETTGLSPDRDRITEIGVVKVRGGDVLGEFQCLVHPGRPVPPAVSAITGITDALVADRPPIEAALPALLEFLTGTTMVAHNAHFDLGFIRAACAHHDYPAPSGTPVCTARLARRVLGRDEVRDARLATLANYLRARVAPEHRALTDARATVDVLHGLLERVGSLGVSTLEDLRDYARSTSDPAFRKVSLVDGAPDAAGVYRFLDTRGEVLYVGRSRRLRGRLRTYFGQDRRRRTADLVRETARVTWEVTATELEAEVREVREIHAHRPRYNRRSRHPERAAFVKLTRERFPRLSIVSTMRDTSAPHVGPLASRRVADGLVSALHDVTALRQCKDRITASSAPAPCVLKEIGRCGAPCDGSQDQTTYEAVVAEVVAAIEEDPTQLLGRLRRRMTQAAADGRYERATEARRRLHDVARILLDQRRLRALAAVPRLVAVRATGSGTELVVVSHGRLLATRLLPHALSDADALAAAARVDGARADDGAPTLPLAGTSTAQIAPEALEEVRLVAAALERSGVRALDVDGVLAEPVAGGSALAETRAEGRRIARDVRRDRDLLRGEKVLARRAR